jgi:hypothetical protein
VSHIDDDAELAGAQPARPHDQYDGFRQLAAAVLELAIADEQASGAPHAQRGRIHVLVRLSRRPSTVVRLAGHGSSGVD